VTEANETDKPATPSGESGLVRLRLDLSYDGSDFSGWARQPDLRTVAQVIEDALATVLRLDEAPSLAVAGRTDAGVHATGQVAHADVPAPDGSDGSDGPSSIDVALAARRLAGVLPNDVVLRALHVAPAGFHARFSALGRRYVYRVNDAIVNPLRRRDTVSWSRPLDVDAMQQGATGLVGEHDFAAYCRPREGATTIRTLHAVEVRRDTDGVVLIAAHADAFCRHQVRSMVGALLAVGEGRQSVGWPAEVLRSRIRDSVVHVVNVAPAHGLTLVAVDYPPDHELEIRASRTRQRRALHPLG
jgi:tRNA pseudouridine38-40 synthase